MPAVRVMPTPMAELVMVLMILGRMMSQSVVSAAQNRSKNSTPLYLARYGRNRRISARLLVWWALGSWMGLV